MQTEGYILARKIEDRTPLNTYCRMEGLDPLYIKAGGNTVIGIGNVIKAKRDI